MSKRIVVLACGTSGMGKYKLTVHCALCSEKHEVEIDLPAGWSGRYNGIDDETGLCPKHAAIEGFIDSQCPGCVSGWGECGLFSAFAFSDRRTITWRNLIDIERGVCPFRVNGTFAVGSGGVEVVDLRNDVRTDSGIALAQAIRDYCRSYLA